MDPYQVLGVSPNASDDEVKKAYREQARKYHPDNYHDNPLADLAGEKMKSVNEAYDAILKMRERGNTGSARQHNAYSNPYGNAYSTYAGGSGSSAYAHIRVMIARNDLTGAEYALNAAKDKNAEWHFLMGSVYYRKGFLDKARQHIQQAVTMEPHNREYQTALYQLQSGGYAYRPGGAGVRNTAGCDCCDCCAALLCMNCLCG